MIAPGVFTLDQRILDIFSRVFSVPIYQRQKRIVWPLALSFGIGAPFGAVSGSWFSKNYLGDMTLYRPVFGALVALVAARVLYEAWAKSASRSERAKKATEISERARLANISKNNSDAAIAGQAPKTLSVAWNKIHVLFADQEFDFNPVGVAASAFFVTFLGASIDV